jgi:hypothetical protein
MNRAVQENEYEQQLRAEHQLLCYRLDSMASVDANYEAAKSRKRLVEIEVRGIMRNRGLDLCARPECLEIGRETVTGRQYCSEHAKG